MNNPNYNSLSDMLKQSGIIPEENNSNIFEKIPTNLDNEAGSDFVEIPKEYKIETEKLQRKRLNQYDLELIQNKNNSNIEHLRRLSNQANSGVFEYFFFKLFPKFYAAKLIKKAMEKFRELNIDTTKLLDKTIPYGENDTRYDELVKYINCANEIQTELKEKL